MLAESVALVVLYVTSHLSTLLISLDLSKHIVKRLLACCFGIEEVMKLGYTVKYTDDKLQLYNIIIENILLLEKFDSTVKFTPLRVHNISHLICVIRVYANQRSACRHVIECEAPVAQHE